MTTTSRLPDPPPAVLRYVTFVVAAGVAVCVLAGATASRPQWTGRDTVVVALLVAGLIIGEWLPAGIWRADSYREYTFSGPFTVALIMIGPLWLVLVAQAVALVSEEIRQRRPLLKTGFNLAQYALGITGARATYAFLTDRPFNGHAVEIAPSDILPGIAAAGVYFLISTVLVAVVLGLVGNEPLLPSVVGQIRDEISMTTTLLCMAPVLMIALEFSPYTAPLCLLPIAAVRQAVLTASASDVQARHDALTGLPNRTLLMQRSRRVADLAREGEQTGLLLLDLDHFKEINDTLGHQVGDELLRLVADRLTKVVREGDTVARFGGDEFAVLCP